MKTLEEKINFVRDYIDENDLNIDLEYLEVEPFYDLIKDGLEDDISKALLQGMNTLTKVRVHAVNELQEAKLIPLNEGYKAYLYVSNMLSDCNILFDTCSLFVGMENHALHCDVPLVNDDVVSLYVIPVMEDMCAVAIVADGQHVVTTFDGSRTRPSVYDFMEYFVLYALSLSEFTSVPLGDMGQDIFMHDCKNMLEGKELQPISHRTLEISFDNKELRFRDSETVKNRKLYEESDTIQDIVDSLLNEDD